MNDKAGLMEKAGFREKAGVREKAGARETTGMHETVNQPRLPFMKCLGKSRAKAEESERTPVSQ